MSVGCCWVDRALFHSIFGFLEFFLSIFDVLDDVHPFVSGYVVGDFIDYASPIFLGAVNGHFDELNETVLAGALEVLIGQIVYLFIDLDRE